MLLIATIFASAGHRASDLSPAEFLVIFPTMWLTILYVLSWLGGWRALADVYADPTPFDGERFHMRSGTMRASVNYGSCLTFGANREGLRLKVFPIFRFAHAPLFFPWSDVGGVRKKFLFFSSTVLTFKRCPGIPLRISDRLASDLERCSSGAFAVSPPN